MKKNKSIFAKENFQNEKNLDLKTFRLREKKNELIDSYGFQKYCDLQKKAKLQSKLNQELKKEKKELILRLNQFSREQEEKAERKFDVKMIHLNLEQEVQSLEETHLHLKKVFAQLEKEIDQRRNLYLNLKQLVSNQTRTERSRQQHVFRVDFSKSVDPLIYEVL